MAFKVDDDVYDEIKKRSSDIGCTASQYIRKRLTDDIRHGQKPVENTNAPKSSAQFVRFVRE
jgi:antitoxin component of RelBE/YafQ-DinJ toxin-antitoxin module